jgi:hypothetical protein
MIVAIMIVVVMIAMRIKEDDDDDDDRGKFMTKGIKIATEVNRVVIHA